jgi:MGT family glycosyltransferase
MMSTVLACTSPAIGHLFPMVPLLTALRDRGHRVHLRTLPEHTAALQGLGLSAASVDAEILAREVEDYRARSMRAALAASVSTFTDRARFDGPDLQKAIDAVRPDLLLVDINCWGARSVAEASGLPWAVFSPYTPPLDSKGTPPFGPGLLPLRGPLGRARDAVARRLVLGAAEGIMLPRINRLRAEVSGGTLPPVGSADAFFRAAPLTLVGTAEPFEYPHTDWAPRIRMIGALGWEPPGEPPAWLDSLTPPLVLVTTSSEYQADEAIVRAALEGLAGEGFSVVATIPAPRTGAPADGPADGSAAATRAFADVPANARLERFVPHGQVLERATVAVTHGGMGATQKALAHGVPVVVVPFGRDQHEVAARVVASRAGVRLSPRRLTGETLRAAVREAQGMAEGARRVAEGYAAAGGAAAGADALEELLAGRGTPRGTPAARRD